MIHSFKQEEVTVLQNEGTSFTKEDKVTYLVGVFESESETRSLIVRTLFKSITTVVQSPLFNVHGVCLLQGGFLRLSNPENSICSQFTLLLLIYY